jgi:acetamidase/formamidase
VRDIDLSIVHFLSGPIGVKGAEPGDLLVVDLLDVGALKESLWGFNGFFSKKNGGGFLTEHFPLAQKSIWDIKGLYHPSRHVPGVNFAGLIHPGLIGCLPDPKLLETWNEREVALIATNPTRVPPLANPPFAATAHGPRQRRRQGQDRRRRRPHGAAARARRQLRHQGSVARLEDLLPGLCAGAGLSMGDLHFSQGDGEITFCGAIEMAGWLHLKVEIIKDGVAKYGIKNPIFKPSPITPNYKDYLIFEGISVDEAGQAALPRRAHRLSAGLPERDRVSEEVRLFRRAGLFDPGHRAGAGPHQRRGRRAERLRDAVAADGDLRLRHHAVVGRPDQTHQGRCPDAALTGQIISRATGCGTAVSAAPHPPLVSSGGAKRARE